MTDIGAVQKEIEAIKIALGSYAEFIDKETERVKHLVDKKNSILNSYVFYTYKELQAQLDKLQAQLDKLQEKENLLLAHHNQGKEYTLWF